MSKQALLLCRTLSFCVRAGERDGLGWATGGWRRYRKKEIEREREREREGNREGGRERTKERERH